MTSTAHTANKSVTATRKERRGGVWNVFPIEKPLLIDGHNSGMQGVDRSDQLIASYNVLMKCVRWWKTLFLHRIDIAVVDSLIISLRQNSRKALILTSFPSGLSSPNSCWSFKWKMFHEWIICHKKLSPIRKRRPERKTADSIMRNAK
ncbi:hypothetical protein MTO96_038839 [Rhipicephalus appendiculatus]